MGYATLGTQVDESHVPLGAYGDVIETAPGLVRQIQATVHSASSNIYLGIFSAACVALVMYFWGGSWIALAVWFALLAVGQCLGLYLLGRVRILTTDFPRYEVEKTARSLVLVAGYCGAAWGGSAWVMLPANSSGGEVFLLVIMGLIFAGSGFSAAYAPVNSAFVLAGIAVFSSGLLRFNNDYQQLIAAGFLVLALAILRYSKNQHEVALQLIQLGVETEQLLQDKVSQQEITESLRLQAEKATEVAKAANQGKTAFLAAAGHDLRQPMHALVQYHAYLERHNDDSRLNDTIERIGRSLDAMQDMLDSMLEVSRLLTGSVRPAVRQFEVDELLQRLDAQLRPVAEDKGLNFEVETCAALLETDDVLLERILRNLALNAIRYTPSGKVLIRARRRAGQVRFQVWDTGIGISPENRERIFEEFFQVENEARDRRKGLGLGLALVRQMSSLLGFRLKLNSVVGKGSVFMVEVQRAVMDRRAPEVQACSTVRDFVRGAAIVLIDDNESSLEATAQTIKGFGARVIKARSGFEAIERLQRQEFAPQLVVSDYRLENGETGLDAIKMVIDNQRALFGEEFDIAAFVISGDTAPAEIMTVKQAGYVLLHKPVAPKALYAAINEALTKLAITQ